VSGRKKNLVGERHEKDNEKIFLVGILVYKIGKWQWTKKEDQEVQGEIEEKNSPISRLQGGAPGARIGKSSKQNNGVREEAQLREFEQPNCQVGAKH